MRRDTGLCLCVCGVSVCQFVSVAVSVPHMSLSLSLLLLSLFLFPSHPLFASLLLPVFVIAEILGLTITSLLLR